MLAPLLAAAALLANPYLQAPEELEPEAFRDPPHAFGMVPLWSWNGDLDPAEIRRQIRLLLEQGVHGAFMHARAGIDLGTTPYFSEGWWRAVEAAIDEGGRAGFEPWIYDEDKWPSGSAGGRTIAADPERNRALRLRLTERTVIGPADRAIHEPGAWSVVAGRVVGAGRLADLVDLTETATGPEAGARWRAPKGTWRIITARPVRIDGINYLRPETVATFIRITHEAYARRFGDALGRRIPGVFFDEIHNSGGDLVWSEAFPARFEALTGRSLRGLLPALRYDIGPRTEVVRCDYYATYAALYEEAWFAQTARWCEAHGLAWTGHTNEDLANYRDQADYFATMRHLAIPLTDNEDFRYRYPRRVGPWKPCQIASVAHLYDRPRAGVEAMGGAGWTFTPAMARYGFHLLAAYGINFFVPHLFHYAIDRPENDADWPPSWFFRNPYWKYFRVVADDVRRLGYALSCGKPVASVAVLHPLANLWAGKGGGQTAPLVEALVRAQVEFDLIDADSVRAGKLGRYRAAVLPGIVVLEEAVLEKLEAFARAGGVLVAIEPLPAISRERGRGEEAFLRRVKALFPEEGTTAFPTRGIPEAVEILRARVPMPLRVLEGDESALRHVHRRTPACEIFWLANDEAEPRRYRLRIRAAGAAELWDTETGGIEAIAAHPAGEGAIEVEVTLGPRRGRLLVIHRGRAPGTAAAATEGGPARETPIRGPWTFLVAPKDLDEAWRIDVEEASVAIPVTRFQPERRLPFASRESLRPEGLARSVPLAGGDAAGRAGGRGAAADPASPELDDGRWRLVQLLDPLEPDRGASLYRSAWDAAWITAYEYRGFHTRIGGDGVRLERWIHVDGRPAEAALYVASRGAARIEVNDREIASIEGAGGVRAVRGVEGFRIGANRIRATVRKPGALLLEGWLRTDDGRLYRIVSDRTWLVRPGEGASVPAWEYLRPPDPPWGEPAGGPPPSAGPFVAWYRTRLPAGTVAVDLPRVEGRIEAYLDGRPAIVRREGDRTRIEIGRPARDDLLALRVAMGSEERGLLGELVARCRPAEVGLVPWSELGLPWHSGRGVYRTTVGIQGERLEGAASAEIDLGDVRHACEVWVNGRLAGVRPWPPYRVEVRPLLRPGRNEIAVVVANLLANRMFYTMYTRWKADRWSRQWHDGNIRRDAQALVSGLLGPVVLRVRGR